MNKNIKYSQNFLTSEKVLNQIIKQLNLKETDTVYEIGTVQFKKSVPSDEGRQRQAALLAFSAFAELKHVFLVDEDVDCFDLKDVMWAMTTRFQADLDLIQIPGIQCHPLDPSNGPEYSPHIRARGVACKAIFDCTVPFDQKKRFTRAKFMNINMEKWKDVM